MRSYKVFVDILISLFYILTTFFMIDSKLKDKKENNFIVKFIYCLILLIIDALIDIYVRDIYTMSIAIITSVIVIFIYLYFFKVGRIYYKIYISVMYISFLIVITYMVMLILGFIISRYRINNSYNTFELEIFAVIIIRIILIIATFLLEWYIKGRKSSNKVSRNFFSIIIILIIGILGSYGIKEETFSVVLPTNKLESNKGLYIPMALAIFNIYFIVEFSKYEKDIEIERNLENKIKKYELQKEYNDKVYEIYKEMRAWRHDYRNNIQAIGNLAKCGDIEGIRGYILNLNIGLDNSECIVYTGNNIIDSILTTKILTARTHEISFDLKIDKIIKIDMDNMDISTLLGNLLDNAIEACQRTDEDRFIKVSMVNIKNQFIIIVENSTNGKVNCVDGKYLTSKTGGDHGIGMSQIDKVVDKYNGYINRAYDGRKFKTTIVFSGITTVKY